MPFPHGQESCLDLKKRECTPHSSPDDATLRFTRSGVQISWPPACSLDAASVQILLSLDRQAFHYLESGTSG